MQEIRGDLWTTVAWPDAILVMTNAQITKGGLAVMGKGIAREASDHFPWLRTELAHNLRKFDNQSYIFDVQAFGGSKTLIGERRPTWIGTYPTKRHWMLPAEFHLIEKSAKEWKFLANAMNLERIVLPRPGCGNGGLVWRDVKSLIEKYLDDRFIIVDREAP